MGALIEQPATSATQIRPVSRISFSLTDKDAFEKSAQFAVDWLAGKIGGALPDEARALASFDTRGSDGFHPCHAVRVDDHSGSIWAARIDEPGSNPSAGEIWSTEMFVERPVGGLVRFGAQLMTRRSANSPDIRPSRPRLIYDLLSTLSAEADGEAIADVPAILTTHDDADTLARLIYRPKRRLPVVVVSTDYDGWSQVNLQQLGVRLSGAAHLYAARPETSWELTRLIGKRMSTFNGGVRIYMPGIEEEDEDPFQHPLWLIRQVGTQSRADQPVGGTHLPARLSRQRRRNALLAHRPAPQGRIGNRRLETVGSETEKLEAQVAASAGRESLI